MDTVKKGKVVYCYFSCRRPKNRPDIGYFSVAMYKDLAGNKFVTYKTREYKLWENNLYTTAVQAYGHALRCVYEWQSVLKKVNVQQVMLVTSNNVIAEWIENPYKNRAYTDYITKAMDEYKVGSSKQINIGIGLCEVQKVDRAHKYCKEEYVSNKAELEMEEKKSNKSYFSNYKIKIKEYKKVDEVVNEESNEPKVVNIKEIIED